MVFFIVETVVPAVLMGYINPPIREQKQDHMIETSQGKFLNICNWSILCDLKIIAELQVTLVMSAHMHCVNYLQYKRQTTK